jgi:hypothetical protein
MTRRLVVIALLALAAGWSFAEYHDMQVGLIATAEPFDSEDDSRLYWIGAVLHLTPALAIRPQAMIWTRTSDVTGDLAVDAAEDYEYLWAAGALDVLYYIPLADAFSVYIGAGARYYVYSRDTDYADGDEQELRQNELRVAVLGGAEALITQRFGFYANVGFGFFKTSYTTTENFAGGGETEVTTEGTNFNSVATQLGAVFYLN